jgi:S1-C subfamily serine protease
MRAMTGDEGVRVVLSKKISSVSTSMTSKSVVRKRVRVRECKREMMNRSFECSVCSVSTSKSVVRKRVRVRECKREMMNTSLNEDRWGGEERDDDENDRVRAMRMITTKRGMGRVVMIRMMIGMMMMMMGGRGENGAEAEPMAETIVGNVTALTEREEQITKAFDRASKACVNVVDVTLLSQSGMQKSMTGSIVPEGNGSGVVFDADNGYIVTNYHVVQQAISLVPKGREIGEVAKVTIEMKNGQSKTFPGQLVGYARSKDIAVLKINAEKGALTGITFGSSENVKVGQNALAIGNPFGFDHTLTTGIVSGKNRTIETFPGSFVSGAIQTDAAINPGNSGGPLIDINGYLIGINAAIFTNTGQNVGVGFAIPVDVVRRVVLQLIENNKKGLQEGVLDFPGLNCIFADEKVRKALKVNAGVVIQSFDGKEKTALEKAGALATRRGLSGIVAGDSIIKFNGQIVNSERELRALVESENVGDSATVTVTREGSEKELDFKIILERAVA